MASGELLKWVKKLHLKKYRDREGAFLIEGSNLVLEALKSDFKILHFFVTPEFMESDVFVAVKRYFQKKDFPIQKIGTDELKAISETKTPQGILAVVQKQNYMLGKRVPAEWKHVVLLDHLQDPGNLGTIIRAADWFGFDAVILSKGSVEATNGKVLRATAGSFFHLPVFENAPLLGTTEKLFLAGFQVFAAKGNGILDHFKIDFRGKVALIVGNERHGVQTNFSGIPIQTVRIPKRGKGESLNAAMAATILMDRIAFQGRSSIEPA